MRNLLFLCLLLPWHAVSQPSSLEDAIQQLMSQHRGVGLAVAVVKDGQLAYANAFGLKDINTKEPLEADDLFRIASISKSFSATSIMQLVEAKKLTLDDDFGKLVGFPIRNPRFPNKVITLRMVLSHTSSINDSQGYFNFDVINPTKNPDWAKCYNDYAPGDGYQYCNLNFNMVGAVIERMTGQRFDVYVKEHILRPLDLNAGYCVDSLDNSLFATLHEFDSASGFTPSPAAYAPRREQLSDYTMGYSTPVFSPTGGMKISAPHLARYMTMHMYFGEYKDTRIISKRSAKTMQTPVAKKEGYGLALAKTEKLIKGKTMIGHTGSAYGLYSAMFFHPKEKFGFVVITNGCQPVYKDGYLALLHETINVLYRELISSQ